MTLIALGINHNTASLDVREKVAFSSTQIESALRAAIAGAGLSEVAILSTCNRTELYAYGSSQANSLIQWLAEYKQVNVAELEQSHYLYTASEAASHMMKVASGLDSLVLGEPQILGQMKSAYAVAREAGVLGGHLHDVFQRVFSVAKRVRSETAIGENPVSVAYAAVSLAQQIFSDLKQDTALLIGAGETIELVARHLAEQGIKKLIVANRTLGNARSLAEQFGAEAILLADIPEHLHRADIVISSTASQLPLLGKGAVEQALKRRRHKPMFMVDIAVPRDIEAQVGDLADVYLYTVDDLKEVIDENMRSRQQAAKIAEEIIVEGLLHYEREQRALTSVDTIKALRQTMDALREQELEKSRKALEAGADPAQVLEQLARSLTNKFLHTPSTQLKQAGADGEQDMLRTVRTLFSLPSANESKSEKE
ncbi:glutamyl-tRNA reductase [Saccharophagus degradans]|uniref:Glutamyl-tRNA reductase n=1 Tax=Saccharophagus degradans (strain 2-40 / ATCC 43961 / DSM 17024) TaxID=203122 RepID=HEM1_SACD2|nr:glutamyl-tRNA reductase [Saccharophagus degradans]Q21FM2.1 RecName: Full=Glutamyl-tRNA reductase; Short=GluTR [Saccharophagus degradans 2-40]ABD82507.1 glutamyl-tRNA reductase [Saccharophagus degradans 2-40]